MTYFTFGDSDYDNYNKTQNKYCLLVFVKIFLFNAVGFISLIPLLEKRPMTLNPNSKHNKIIPDQQFQPVYRSQINQ